MKRRVSVFVNWSQAYRIRCDHCGEPYVVVRGGEEKGVDAYDSSMDVEEQNRVAFRRVANGIASAAASTGPVRSPCPHCHRMPSNAQVGPADALKLAGGVSLVLAFVAALITFAIVEDGNPPGLAELINMAGAAGGTLLLVGPLSAWLAWKTADRPGDRYPEGSPKARTDAAFLGMLEQGQTLQQWHESTGLQLGLSPKTVHWEMGLLDTVTPALQTRLPPAEERIRWVESLEYRDVR